MQIETVGKYQLRLTAQEISPPGGWDPYVAIFKFDDDMQDFKCVLEKRHASDEALPTYDAAIEQARRVGNTLLEQENL